MESVHHTRAASEKGLLGLAFAGLLAMMLTALLFAAPAFAQDAESPVYTTEDCLECHAFVSADIISSWQNQNHGRNDVGCPVCHNNHVQDFRPSPTVAVCMECHDVEAAHPGGFTPEDEAARCMECHAANVHLPPGEGSWLNAGLPPERLTEDPRPASTITEAQAQVSSAIVVILALFTGLVLGLLMDRFVRNL